MSPSSKSRGRRAYSKHPKLDKHILKFLTHCNDRNVTRQILKGAPDSVIKGISNAALNAEQGDVHISPQNQKLFSQHRTKIHKLTLRKVPIATKRRLLLQQGGSFLGVIAPLLASVIGSIGGALFNRGGNQ